MLQEMENTLLEFIIRGKTMWQGHHIWVTGRVRVCM